MAASAASSGGRPCGAAVRAVRPLAQRAFNPLSANEQVQAGEGVADHDQHHGELTGELMARGQ